MDVGNSMTSASTTVQIIIDSNQSESALPTLIDHLHCIFNAYIFIDIPTPILSISEECGVGSTSKYQILYQCSTHSVHWKCNLSADNIIQH